MNNTHIDNATRTAQIDAEIARLQDERFELMKELPLKVRSDAYDLIVSATDIHCPSVDDAEFADKIAMLLFGKKKHDLVARETGFIFDLIESLMDEYCVDLIDDAKKEIRSAIDELTEDLLYHFDDTE